MVLAVHGPWPSWDEWKEGVPTLTEEVLTDLVPGSNDLRAVCIALAHLAAKRWPEVDVLAELTRELDLVEHVKAMVAEEGDEPVVADEDDEP